MFTRARRSAVAGLALLTVGPLGGMSVASAVEVDPGTGPDYEMPFPCGEAWTGTTRASHSPSASSVDFNRVGDLGDLMAAAARGRVSRVGDTGATSYGRYIVVDHGDARSTLYAHLRAVWVTEGQQVDTGTVLGVVGESGGVTGAHLHFEERVDGRDHQPYFHRVDYAFGTTSASGNCADVPLAGDWDGDGDDDVAVFRRGQDGAVFRTSRRSGAAVDVVRLGQNSEVPVVGDWDGDGQTDVGVRRTRRRTFRLRDDSGALTRVRFGGRRDVPVAGDWDGDGTDEVGVWRPHTRRFRLLLSSGLVRVVRLGGTGSVPLTGDWDGDGIDDVGVFVPATAAFRLRTEDADGRRVVRRVPFGTPTDLPVTGDWDGDGRTDVGVWRPATATYALRLGVTAQRRTADVVRERFGRRR